MIAKVFSAMISKSFQGGMSEGIEVGNNGVVMSHLQFIDDTLIMCKNSARQLMLLRCVIDVSKRSRA